MSDTPAERAMERRERGGGGLNRVKVRWPAAASNRESDSAETRQRLVASLLLSFPPTRRAPNGRIEPKRELVSVDKQRKIPTFHLLAIQREVI